jgi:serine/threonine-protein kinase
MEHVEGVPVDQHCRARHLGLEQCLALFLGICEAVSFAHQRLVIHCDIKPANVLVDRRGRPVLLDFGIARLADRVDEHAAQAFTPGFESPEQRAGEPLGTATDIYSLGKLLEALAPAVPQRARRWELQRIVAKASAQAAADRYPSAYLLAEDVRRYLAREPLRAIAPTPAYRLRKYAERRPLELLVAGVFALMSVAFVLRIGDERDAAVAARKEAEVQRDRARQAETEATRQRDPVR